jgi:hypothetical protein
LGSRNHVHHVSNDGRAAAPLWDAVLQPELFAMADELVRADALLDDPAFFVALTPFPRFDHWPGRRF